MTKTRSTTKKIGAVYDALFALRKQMIKTRRDAMNKIRGVLLKEQLDQLKRMRCGGMVHGGIGMMGQ